MTNDKGTSGQNLPALRAEVPEESPVALRANASLDVEPYIRDLLQGVDDPAKKLEYTEKALSIITQRERELVEIDGARLRQEQEFAPKSNLPSRVKQEIALRSSQQRSLVLQSLILLPYVSIVGAAVCIVLAPEHVLLASAMIGLAVLTIIINAILGSGNSVTVESGGELAEKVFKALGPGEKP
jgi:hypothetical protein